MRRGFTLIEVLLATALASVIALAVAHVIGLMHTTQERVRDRAARRALVGALERKITADLRAVVPPGGIYAAGLIGENETGASSGEALMDEDLLAQVTAQTSSSDDPAPIMERDRLTLSVLPPARTFGVEAPAGEGSLWSVLYFIDDDPATEERGLVRQVARVRDQPEGVEPEPPQQVATEVVAMDLQFFDGQEWQETWDSGGSDTLPTAIEITLVVVLGTEVFTYKIMTAPAQGRPSALLEADE